jgi:hypothetical protein
LIVRERLIIDNRLDHFADVGAQQPIDRDADKLRDVEDRASPRCASTIQIVRPWQSMAETQPQLQPALLRLSAIVSQYFMRKLTSIGFTAGLCYPCAEGKGKNTEPPTETWFRGKECGRSGIKRMGNAVTVPSPFASDLNILATNIAFGKTSYRENSRESAKSVNSAILLLNPTAER